MAFRSAADFALTIQSVYYPFMLGKDEHGYKTMGDGLAPMVAPQFRTDGFGYQHVPPEIEVIESFERFTAGCGFEGVGGVRTSYNYTRGIDLSYGDRAFVALKRRAVLESDGTAIGAAPTAFYHSPTLGFFMAAGPYIYEWDLATTTWVQRADHSGTFSGASYLSFVEIDGVLMASRGTGADYATSTDGITWTAFTSADENADYAVLRGNASDVASVWKINDNLIKVNPDPTANSWTGGDEIGNTGETTRGAICVDNTIYVFKDRAIYTYDGTNTQDVWSTSYIDSSNGKGAYLWGNGKMYAPYGRRLREIDPNPNAIQTIGTAYPTPGMDSTELLGTITALGGDDNWLYMAMKNRAGNTYLMRGNDSRGTWVWHTIAYLGANDCNALSVVGPGVLHATNPAVVFGYGTAGHYTVLPQQDLLPSEDPAVTFETDEGSAYFPYVDFGAQTFPKFLNRGALLGYGLSAGRYATLEYEKDRDGAVTSLVAAVGDSLTEANEDDEVEFHLIRAVLLMATGDSSATPTVDALALGATLNPTRKRTWNPRIVLSDGIEFRDGEDMEVASPSAALMRRILFASVRRRLTLTDRDGITYTVRLLDIQPVALKDKDMGDAEYEASSYVLTLVEINTLTSDETVGIYDESDYDAGHVFGDV